MEPGLEWRSLQWPDGSMYEGLTKEGVCHANGVMHYANGDRYEGEFMQGKQNGYGVYVWSDGMIYRGEWMEGTTHGCGVKLWKDNDQGFSVKEGKFLAGEYVGPVLTCSSDASHSTAVEADYAAALARSLQTEKGQQQRRAFATRQRQPKPPSLPWPFSIFAPKAGNHPAAAGQPARVPSIAPQPATPEQAAAAPAGDGLQVVSKYKQLAPRDQVALARAVDKLVSREIGLMQAPAASSTAS